MRRLFAWVAGALGGLAAWRLVRRSRGGALEAPPAPAELEPDPRAEELRARLAEREASEPEPEADVPPAETAVAEPVSQDDPEERRRRVHEAGRAALDEMSGPE